ncbi:MAG: YjbH domain-containing protein, partial [Thiotrichales bacterium]|nr:YjbH domain-containing protein [Thiotrichales bacterium]
MRTYSAISVLCLAFGTFLNTCQAETLKQTQSVSGGVGLIENPTARMNQDGEWGVHLSHIYPYNRYVVFGQPLPWLEVLFKYTDIENRTYGGTLTQGYKDKSVDIKARLWEEDYYWPEVSVGIRDVGGTGLFSAEYLVASKQWGRWDLSLGLGWGYMASRGDFANPLAELFDAYKSRETDTGKGGTIDPTVFFAGEKMSLFAGTSYHFEDWPLVLKMEYDANDYQNEPKGNVFEQVSPFNIGMVYSPANGLDVHLGYARGNQVMLGVTLRTNVSESKALKVLDTKPEMVDWQRPQTSKVESWQKLSQDVCDQSGFCSTAIYLEDKAITLVGDQTTYIAKAKGIGRASRVLTNRLDPSLETFNFIERNNGLDVNTVSIDRDKFHRAVSLEIEAGEVLDSTQFNEFDKLPQENKVYEEPLKALRYNVTPTFSGSYGGPEAFLLYQVSLLGSGSYHITDKTWLSGAIDVGLIDNYDLFIYSSAS